MKFARAKHKQFRGTYPKYRLNKHWHAWFNPALKALFTAATILLSLCNCVFDSNIFWIMMPRQRNRTSRLACTCNNKRRRDLQEASQRAWRGIAQTSGDLASCIQWIYAIKQLKAPITMIWRASTLEEITFLSILSFSSKYLEFEAHKKKNERE